MFKIAKRMVKTNQNIFFELCLRDDDSALAVSDVYKKMARKSYDEKLSNTQFAWDRNNLSKADTVSGIPCLIEKAMVHESISKLRNGKAAGPSGVVSEMARTGGEAVVDMITDLVNPTIVGVIPAEWELNTIVNCDAGKGDFLERGKYRGMKLIAQDSEDS